MEAKQQKSEAKLNETKNVKQNDAILNLLGSETKNGQRSNGPDGGQIALNSFILRLY